MTKDERIKELEAELLAARAEAALQHNWSCEHDGGCALTDESGYRPQALKYVEDYHALKARIKELEGALRGMIELAEFWINREDMRGKSEIEYKTWLALGFRAKAMERAREALKWK